MIVIQNEIEKCANLNPISLQKVIFIFVSTCSITVIVIEPTTQTDNYMVSAHTAGDGMLNINNNGMSFMVY